MKKLSLFMVVLLLGICITVPGLAKEKMKLAVTAVLHPYFAPMEQSAKDYMEKSGIKTGYRATQHFDQEEANVIIEGMLALGYNGFAMWPGHPDSVNATITELVNDGIPVVLIAGPAKLPTDASLCIATDVGASAAQAAENLIKELGGKGKILNLLGQLSDPNTLIRKKAIEDVIAKYPDVELLAEIAEIDAFEAATTKIDAFLSSRSKEVDGMVSTAYVPTVVAAEALAEIGDKRIKFVGIDDDPKVIKAIKEGYVTGTMTQSPYGQALVGLEALKLLKSGYTVKKDKYFVDSGSFMVSKDNADTYAEIIKANAMKLLENLEKDYFDPPK